MRLALFRYRQILVTLIMVFLLTRLLLMLHTPVPVPFGYERVTVDSMSVHKPNAVLYRNQMKKLLNIIITEYTDWHKEQVELSTSNVTHAQTIPKLVYTSIDKNYALGDVIRGLIHCYLCAVASKRLFLLNLTDPFPFAAVLDNPPGYDFTYNPAIFAPREGNNTNQPVRFENNVHFDELELFLSNETMLVDETQNILDWDLFLQIPKLYPELGMSKKLAKISEFKPSREEVVPFILKALFRPSAQFQKRISVLVDDYNFWSLKRVFRTKDDVLQRISPNERYVSIHARIGYGLGEKKNHRFNLEARNITFKDVAHCMAQMAIEIANDRRLPTPQKFFISTDTEDFRTILKGEILHACPTAKVHHTRWRTVHLRRIGGLATESKLRHYMNTFIDVYLLSKGESMLFIRSGFSHVALWMGAMNRFVGIQLDNCVRVLNGTVGIRESMHDAVADRAGFHRERYHSVLKKDKHP